MTDDRDSSIIPRGLQYLNTLDYLYVHEETDMVEVLLGIDRTNRYIIKNMEGQIIFNCLEDSELKDRALYCCKRSIDINVVDNYQNTIISAHRPMGSCLPCFRQKIEVYAPPGNFVGSAEATWHPCEPRFDVKDSTGRVVLRIRGPRCVLLSQFRNLDFQILTLDGCHRIGKISKKWAGCAQEFFTHADNYAISFPEDLTVGLKAVMLGACLLIVGVNTFTKFFLLIGSYLLGFYILWTLNICGCYFFVAVFLVYF